MMNGLQAASAKRKVPRNLFLLTMVWLRRSANGRPDEVQITRELGMEAVVALLFPEKPPQ
jgi:hypothetical protein